MDMSVYKHFTATKRNGEKVPLSTYAGTVSLIVNTASKCRFTDQFEQLQSLYETYQNENFAILGFPCIQFDEQEPGTSDEAAEFCQMNYGVTFPIFDKVTVNGKDEE